jgi:hypothetical protein
MLSLLYIFDMIHQPCLDFSLLDFFLIHCLPFLAINLIRFSVFPWGSFSKSVSFTDLPITTRISSSLACSCSYHSPSFKNFCSVVSILHLTFLNFVIYIFSSFLSLTKDLSNFKIFSKNQLFVLLTFPIIFYFLTFTLIFHISFFLFVLVCFILLFPVS